jgi:hypothetical protein
MKKLILPSLILFSLFACKKEEKITPKSTSATASIVKVSNDTIPNNSAFKIQLVKDSINTDETMLLFSPSAGLSYSSSYDAPYFQGFGQVSLASISSDGIDLAIHKLPYKTGMSIGLDVRMKTSGAYSLQLSYLAKMPADVQIWVKDNYLKDSVNVRTKGYSFNVSKADTNSFGKQRFKLVLTHYAQPQTATSH